VCLHSPIARLYGDAETDESRGKRFALARKTEDKFGANEMAQVCDVCGKGPQFGNNISHAHNVTKRRWNVNLQAVKAVVNGAPKRIRVCTSCIKSGKIQKA
jgi:large subunit ribosomal protein L28